MPTTTNYQPSSSEKKAVILIYLLVGIIIVLHKKQIHNWVWGHLHQALGWWVIFLIVSFISLILVFIPILRLLPLLLLIAMIGMWGWFIYRSSQGFGYESGNGMNIFASIGKWITDVMDLSLEIAHEEPST